MGFLDVSLVASFSLSISLRRSITAFSISFLWWWSLNFVFYDCLLHCFPFSFLWLKTQKFTEKRRTFSFRRRNEKNEKKTRVSVGGFDFSIRIGSHSPGWVPTVPSSSRYDLPPRSVDDESMTLILFYFVFFFLAVAIAKALYRMLQSPTYTFYTV